MTHEAAYGLAKLCLIVLGVQLCVLTYVFATGYSGRRNQVEASRKGCERSKLDRKSLAQFLRDAEQARREDGNLRTANKYAANALAVEERSRIKCSEAFPKARLIP